MPPRRSRRQVQRRADHARRAGRAARAWPPAPRRGRAIRTSRKRRSSFPTARPRPTGTRMCAMRHMHEYGTTSEQLAWIKVAASHHAQHNPHAMLRDVVTVEDVVNSPMIADPLHRLDCCVITDGGGALIVVSAGDRQEPEAAAGEDDRRRRGAEAADRRHVRPDHIPARARPARRPSPRRASSPPTSNTPRSTTASPSRC